MKLSTHIHLVIALCALLLFAVLSKVSDADNPCVTDSECLLHCTTSDCDGGPDNQPEN